MGTIVYGGYYLWRLMSTVDIICGDHCLRWILSVAANVYGGYYLWGPLSTVDIICGG